MCNIPAMRESTNNLLPYQVEAANAAIIKKKMLINLPAGSGKTLIALTVASRVNSIVRILIVCPSFLKLNWQLEVDKWFPKSLGLEIINTQYDAVALKNRIACIAAVGYSFFEKKGNTKYLTDQQWDLVICDESHKIRKWTARRCKNVINLCKGKSRLLFLSATPLVSSAADLHPTFSIMQPGVWGKFGEFREKYCKQKHDIFTPTGITYYGIRNSKELKERSREFIFTARKKDILSQLPPKRIIDTYLDIGKCEEFDNLEEYIDHIADGLDDDEYVKTERERVGLAKVDDVLELIETFPRNEQVVIFAYHRSVVETISKRIKGSRFIVGGMSERARMERVTAFTNGEFKYLILSIGAGGLGYNLQTSSIGIFAELPYTYAEFEQCCDRIHRLGSERKVRIYKMVAANSMDERTNEIIETKRLAAEDAGVAT